MREGPTAAFGGAHVVTIGNAKGGSGKSTTALHVATRLMALGRRVAVVDLDWHQQTLTRFLEHRARLCARRHLALTMPTAALAQPHADDAQTQQRLIELVEPLREGHDVVVIDCPGSAAFLAQVAHGLADTLITPLNDSFVDLDILADVDADTLAVRRPGWYSEMVWERRKLRFLTHRQPLDWLVLRNRVGAAQARNKRNMGRVLASLGRHIGFREGKGLGERVIYRELFLHGLTLADLRAHDTGIKLTMNHLVAHQEVRDLVAQLRLPRPVSEMRQRAS